MPVPTTYDLGGFENMTGLNSMVKATDSVIFNGLLGALLLIGLAAILYILIMKSTNSPQKSILATSFICFILSLMGWALEIVSEKYMWITLCVFIFALAMTKNAGD